MQDPSSESAIAREPEIERVILLRGVVWQGKEVNAFKMWQDLMRFWPTPFAAEHTQPPNQLYAHAGAVKRLDRENLLQCEDTHFSMSRDCM